MRFADVSLTDFGCYRNARVDDLPRGLGVVAGPQRAGKTTFMQAVRKLPFGIDGGDDVPPATRTHELAATVEHGAGEYALRVRGRAAPDIDPLGDAAELTLADAVGGLTRDQYQQLFTISLRELQRMPEGVDSEEALSEILLGAAYGDVSEVPALRDSVASDAYSIGAKYGRKNVSQLGSQVEQIRDAVEDRETAKRTVDEYDEKRGELAEVEDGLADLEARETDLAAERTRVSILDKRFEDLQRYRECREELAALPEPTREYPDDAAATAESLASDLERAGADATAARGELAAYAECTDVDDYGAALLERADAVERYERTVEKWRSEEDAIEAEADALDAERRDLERRVGALGADWTSLEEVRAVTADELTRERVREVTTRVESFRDEKRETRAERDATREELAALRDELAAAERVIEDRQSRAADGRSASIVGAGVAAVGLLVGAGVGVATAPFFGYLVTALGIGAGFYYTTTRLDDAVPGVETEPVREFKNGIATREANVDGLERSLGGIEDELAEAEATLDDLRERFDLPADAPPKAVREFYDAFSMLRDDVRSYDARVEEHDDATRAFDETLRDVAGDLGALVEFGWDDGAPREHSGSLYAAVETAAEAVEAARRHEEARDAVGAQRERAAALLADRDPEADEISSGRETDAAADTIEGLLERLQTYAEAAATAARRERLRDEVGALEGRIAGDFQRSATVEAFEPVRSELETDGGTGQDAGREDAARSATDAWAIPALERLADRYATTEEIEAKLEEVDADFDELADEREVLRNRRASIEERLQTLASDDDLKAAEARIQRGGEKLRTLGEAYATNRIAEHLLDRLHDRFLERATGPLLEEASEIFSRITDTYDEVAHAGEPDSLEFVARRGDGREYDTGALSRATAEQLFLSVRLARIRQFDEPMPVVIDDAMTNFDPAHTRRSLAFLDEIARTNQVLLLTCHPRIVRLADEVADVEGYWRLTDGQFDGPASDPSAAIGLFDGH